MYRSRYDGLLLPVERGEVGRGLGVFPRRFAHGVDHERGAHDYHATDDEHREPNGVAAGRDLAGRYEAQDEGQQGSAETQTAQEPHQACLLYTSREFPGWKCDLRAFTRYEDFPAEFKAYVEFIERETGVPVKIISVGPDRGETIVR